MGGFSLWHWIILGAIVLLLFGGKGKISDLMGDFAKGIKSFKKGLSDDDEDKTKTAAVETRTIETPATSLNQKVNTSIGDVATPTEKAKAG